MLPLLKFYLVCALLHWIVDADPHWRLEQLSRRDDRSTLCTIRDAQIALVNDKLYFMRGNYTFSSGTSSPDGKLYYLDLTTAFPVEEPIASSTLNSVNVPQDLTPHIQNETTISGPLFYTNDSVYVFAGVGAPDAADHSLPVFNTSTQLWHAADVAGGDFNTFNRKGASVASDTRTGLSFAFGGDLGSIHNGMIRFDASNPSSLKWTNESENSVAGSIPVPVVLEGALVYLPMGESGVLVSFGGYDISKKGSQYGSNFDWDQIPLDKMSIYDIHNSAWYALTATGDVPGNRSQFCAVASAAPDYSSFQITTYGGFDLSGFSENEDVYVLTVPSFRWINMSKKQVDNVEAQNPTIGRANSRCVAYNDGQMISVGGFIRKGKDEVADVSCSSGYPPIRVLDLETFQWTKTFDPKRQYAVPKAVYDLIGGDKSGNATVRQPPDGGFRLSVLTTLFSRTLPNPHSAPKPSQTKTSASDGPNKGAIVGGVVGGIVVVFLLAGLVIFSLRRRRQQRQQKKLTDLSASSDAMKQTPTKYQHVDYPTQPPQELPGGSFYSELPAAAASPPVLAELNGRPRSPQ